MKTKHLGIFMLLAIIVAPAIGPFFAGDFLEAFNMAGSSCVLVLVTFTCFECLRDES